FENSRPTTHQDPTFTVHDSIYYCVANMPGSVPVTATKALTNATLPYVMKVAGSGWHEALRTDPALAQGLHTHDGQLLHAGSAEAHGLELTSAERVLGCNAPPPGRRQGAGTGPVALTPLLSGRGRACRRWVDQRLKPIARSSSRPSSVIISMPHGGIHSQFMRWDSVIGSSAAKVCSSCRSVSGQAAEVRVMSI